MASNRPTTSSSARPLIVGLAALLLAAPTVGAVGPTIDGWRETETFAPGDASSSDAFGGAVAVDGNLAVVGASYDSNDAGEDAGAVYVFARNLLGTWTQAAKLVGDDTDRDDQFGWAVSLDGDTLVAGAPEAEAAGDETGAAYVFTRVAPGAWTQQAKLVPDDTSISDRFGLAVSVDGDQVVVGDSLADPGGKNAAGAAYAFARDAAGTWSQQARLVAPDGDASDQFGEAVSLDGSSALVGAPSDHDPGAEDTGSAYVIEETDGAWSVQVKLPNPEPIAEDQFGAALSLDGDNALVGSPFDDSQGTDYGAVYAYGQDGDGGWSLEDTIRGNDTGFLDSFGSSVALDGDRALVGAPRGSSPHGLYAGASYLFLRDATGNWTQETKLVPSDAGSDDAFGAGTGLDGGIAVVGAPAAFDPPGSAYVYENLFEQVEDRVQGAGDPGSLP